jgi:two-component system C4-dicarboxylate transport response regulator DctD
MLRLEAAGRLMTQPGTDAPLRILVVDDDDFVREALGVALESLGYDVDYARDGRSALDAVARLTPEAVITDLQMPGMDGLELVRELSNRNRGLPVIAISGGGETMLASARRLGAVETFAKPVMDQDLAAAIERCRSARAQ